MNTIIKYHTVRSNTVLTDSDLESLGKNNWKLGGIAQKEEVPPNWALGSTYKSSIYYYHFWQEVVVHNRG